MKTFTLKIQTPEKTAYEGEVTSIRFRSEIGQTQIFAKHATITSTILFSNTIVDTQNGEEKFLIRNGIFAFDNVKNTATLLAQYCELATEVDLTHAKDYLAFIEEQLAKGADLSKFQLVYLEDEKLAIEKQIEVQS